ncbi:MAG: DNA repair and recombination protein RadB [Candidatus Aenigmatarchaeota archaeon]
MRLPVCSPIDKLLGGGLEPGCITNFYGPAATGKTNIALCAAISTINLGKKVLYIDTEGGFSQERMEQMIGGTRRYTDKMILLEPKNWEEQKSTFNRVEAIAKREQLGIIIVDSIVAQWRVTIDDSNFQSISRELGSQLSVLSKIAREKNIPILITNQVYSEPDTGKIELSAKNVVKWWSKNMVELSHAGRTSCRIARIARARSMPEDKQIEFQITNDGLKEVSKLRLF